MVNILLNTKADIEAQTKSDAMPSMCTLERGHLEVVKALLDDKVDINKETTKGGLHYFWHL